MKTTVTLFLAFSVLAACNQDSNFKVPEARPALRQSIDNEPHPLGVESRVTADSIAREANSLPSETVDATSPTQAVVSEVAPIIPSIDPEILTPSPSVEASPSPVVEVQKIPSGIYLLENAFSGRCLDVKDGRIDSGAPMQIWECSETNKNQLFLIENVEGKFYRLTTQNGKALRINSAKIEVGSPVEQGTKSDLKTQEFELRGAGEGFRLILRDRDLVWTVGNASSDGSPVVITPYEAVSSQRWLLRLCEAGVCKVLPK